MKKKLIYLGLTGCILFALCTRLQAQIDSLQAHRYVTRATMYGVGFTNVFDTYLSPQEYKGIDFRVSRELIRMTKLFDGNVSVQNFFQANISYTHNRADNNNTFSGLVNWNYGLHYQFRLTDNFKLLAGGLIDVNPPVYRYHTDHEPPDFPKAAIKKGSFYFPSFALNANAYIRICLTMDNNPLLRVGDRCSFNPILSIK